MYVYIYIYVHIIYIYIYIYITGVRSTTTPLERLLVPFHQGAATPKPQMPNAGHRPAKPHTLYSLKPYIHQKA